MSRRRAQLKRDFTMGEIAWASDEDEDIAFKRGTVGYVDSDPDMPRREVFYPNGVTGEFCFGVEYWEYEALADIVQFRGWIIITKKPPTNPSPPKLSIHYAETWVNEAQANDNAEKISQGLYEQIDDDIYDDFGKVPNEEKAVGIYYKLNHIKLFPHEYNILTPERMRDYVFGMEGEGIPSHELVPRAEADSLILQLAEDTDLKAVRESAILDGCNEAQALALLMGMDIEDAASEFPAVGWFRCLPEYAQYYCSEWEIEE